MSKLYLECYSGISGDMTVGALLDLGADRGKLEKVLASVPAKGFQIKISTVIKSGIEVCDFDVILDAEHENHDHDMNWLYGAGEEHDHHHEHDHEHEHHHDHHQDHGHAEEHAHYTDSVCSCSVPGEHEHAGGDTGAHDHAHHGHDHHHEHRNLQQVNEILDQTEMTESARELAKRIFRIVAEAESEVHGKPLNEVHFHEVGAIDSIVDIIAIAVCYDDLREKEEITEVIAPVLYEGSGTVRCQHGVLPIPVPAVSAIVREHGIRLHLMPDAGEFVTPTGAAAVAALRTKDALPEEFVIRRIGLGAGKREYRRAGFVRAMLLD